MIYLAGDKGRIVIHEGYEDFPLKPHREEQVIRVLGPGEFMGELTLLAPSPCQIMQAVLLTPPCA